MQIVRGLESFRPDAGPSAVALGAFDGIHLGHRAILRTAVTQARHGKLQALVCTFDRHPMEVLQPDRAPLPITTLDERLELIAETEIDTTVVIPFTPAVAGIEAKAFVQDVLVGTLKAQEIVVGFNHRFGQGARGDAQLWTRGRRRRSSDRWARHPRTLVDRPARDEPAGVVAFPPGSGRPGPFRPARGCRRRARLGAVGVERGLPKMAERRRGWS